MEKMVNAMSEDEDVEDEWRGQKIMVSCKVPPEWRSQQLQTLLWSLDELALAEGPSRVTGRKRAAKNTASIRVHPRRVNQEVLPPVGLPNNCYNQAWMAQLSPCDRNALKVDNQDYDFSVSVFK